MAYQKTTISGAERLIEVIEELRKRNADGYLQGYGGIVANIKNHGQLRVPPATTATTCSPFTASAIGVALDPTFPRDDDLVDKGNKPFDPKFDGGKQLTYNVFHTAMQKNNNAVQTIIDYNLGEEVELKKLRRGDLLDIGWFDTMGHAVFVWDVHLDGDGNVDAIQIIGSNGPAPGISIYGCIKPWITGTNSSVTHEEKDWKEGDVLEEGWTKVLVPEPKPKPPPKGAKPADAKAPVPPADAKPAEKPKPKYKVKRTIVHRGDLVPKSPIFVDGDDIVKQGFWLGMPVDSPDPKHPKANDKEIDRSTFRVKPSNVFPSTPKNGFSIQSIRGGRLFYEGEKEPPKPFCMKDGPAAPAKPAGHTTAKAQVVKGEEVKTNPRAPDKVPPKPVKQEKNAVLELQHYVEKALRIFFQTKWIKNDPGSSDDINDGKTQAALKELQGKFDIGVDGIVGKDTRDVVFAQLPPCQMQLSSQVMLGQLFAAKVITNDPGPPDGLNNDKTRAAIEEFQGAQGLKKTGVPDQATQAKIVEALKATAASADQHGPAPEVKHLYWVGNTVAPGGTAKLRLHSRDMRRGQTCAIHLSDEATKKESESTATFVIDKDEVETSVPIPKDFTGGARVRARVVVKLTNGAAHEADGPSGPIDDDGNPTDAPADAPDGDASSDDDAELEATTQAPLAVVSPKGNETVDWQQYIGKDSVPDEIIAAITKNRAQYRLFDLPLKKNGYEGPQNYDYVPGAAHAKWANEWIDKKIAATTGGSRADSHVATTFKGLYTKEGLPAAMQTYDNQVVTWGVGQGAKGNGKETIALLKKDAEMKAILDGFGFEYDKKHWTMHVVDTKQKKVISSTPGDPKKIDTWGNDDRHIPPLEAWRRQMDLLTAFIGIAEDAATRDRCAEAQYAIYKHTSTRWSGQDKVFSYSLYLMIAHLFAWLPAAGDLAIYVENEWKAIGGDTPSNANDAKMAPRILRAFITAGRKLGRKTGKITPEKVLSIARDHVWRDYRADSLEYDKYDPGTIDVSDLANV